MVAFVKLLCKLDEIDYVDIHIYPVMGGFLQRTSEMAEMARRAGKGGVIGKPWLYKATHAESTGAHVTATWAEIFFAKMFFPSLSPLTTLTKSSWGPLRISPTATRFGSSRSSGANISSST